MSRRLSKTGRRAPQHPKLRTGAARMCVEDVPRDLADRYRLLFERNLTGLYRSTASGKILECNEAFARILGYSSPQEAMAQLATDFYPESEKRGKFLEGLRVFGSLRNVEARLRRKDGSEVRVLETVNLVGKDADGQDLLEGTLIDITERTRFEEALAESEERYRLLFENNPQPMWVYDESTLAFLAVNEAACQHYGYSREEFLAMTIRDIRPAEEEPALMAALAKKDKSLRQSGIRRHRTKDGRDLDVEISSHSLEFGGVRARLVLATDVTERKLAEEERQRLEEQLIQSQKIEAVGQLAGGIAHDFNNLLTAISGYTELLIESLPDTDPRRQHADQIRRSAERAAALTQQLLAFSRRQVLEPKPLDLNEVVSGMEEMLRRLIGEHIELRFRRAPELWWVKADPGQLEQAILNLAVNARDAMPEGGRLTIETDNAELDPVYASRHLPAQPGHYAMIAVTDSGSGMTPDVRSHLFEPFFTTKERGKGTGLGLSTTYGIVKQSGGYIWAYSEPGLGSTFKIYLPRVAEPQVEPALAKEAASPSPRESAPANQETILLVEDEPEVRSLVLRLLKMQGYTVIAAANPDEALAITRDFQGTIDLMVTDVVMPGMSGRQPADRLASTRPGMKVLFVSGYTDDAIVHHGMLDPGTAFLQKPFAPQALARKVRDVIEAPTGRFKVS